LNAAQRYAEFGYHVFPCSPGEKTPLTEHGLKDATTDTDRIEHWWLARPNANVAIETTGLPVVDVDRESHWLTENPDRALMLAGGTLSLTANGGRQYTFRQPAGKASRNTAGRLAPHVDTRAERWWLDRIAPLYEAFFKSAANQPGPPFVPKTS
jgi:hypothetical protein